MTIFQCSCGETVNSAKQHDCSAQIVCLTAAVAGLTAFGTGACKKKDDDKKATPAKTPEATGDEAKEDTPTEPAKTPEAAASNQPVATVMDEVPDLSNPPWKKRYTCPYGCLSEGVTMSLYERTVHVNDHMLHELRSAMRALSWAHGYVESVVSHLKDTHGNHEGAIEFMRIEFKDALVKIERAWNGEEINR